MRQRKGSGRTIIGITLSHLLGFSPLCTAGWTLQRRDRRIYVTGPVCLELHCGDYSDIFCSPALNERIKSSRSKSLQVYLTEWTDTLWVQSSNVWLSCKEKTITVIFWTNKTNSSSRVYSCTLWIQEFVQFEVIKICLWSQTGELSSSVWALLYFNVLLGMTDLSDFVDDY